MKIILFIAISLALLTTVELLKRKAVLSNDASRRLAHIGAGAINIAAPWFVPVVAIVSVNIIFAALLLVGRQSKYFTSIQTTDRKTYGDVYFPLGIVIAAVVFLPDSVAAFQYGVAIMGFSDALAGFVGERWGRTVITVLGNRKTVIGSLVFCVSSFAITILFAPQLILAVFLSVFLLTLVELVLVYGLDNLVLPVLAGLLFSNFF